MKTTLKRGIGRGASLNGNGRAVYPPAVLTAMTRYRVEPKRRSLKRLLLRILLWAVLALLVVAAGVAGAAYLTLKDAVTGVTATTPELRKVAAKLPVALPGKPATALIVGYDKRKGLDKDAESRSDTLMLLRADPRSETVSMLSFPRDLVVPIHCPGRTLADDRINSAWSSCGPSGVLTTVSDLTDLPINYVVTVDFHGFKQIVDHLGGVWVDVDRRYFNNHTGPFGYARIDIQPGYQRLNGSDALDFVRYRHTDSDLTRIARQQLFVKAIKQQVSSSLSFDRVLKIVGALKENVQIARAGNEPLDFKTIERYVALAYGLPPGHLFQAKLDNLTPTGPFNAELAAPPGAVESAVQELTAPDVDAADKANAVALGIKRRSRAPRPQETTVIVLNGSGVTGAAANASFELGKLGYTTITPPSTRNANVPGYGYFRTAVYYDPTRPTGKAAATRIAGLFGNAAVSRLIPKVARLANGALVTVVVGQNFHGSLAPAPVDRTPKKQPPNVVSNPGLTASLLRGVRARVPFPLRLPSFVESSSGLDPARPIRAYRIQKDHKAVRLVFRTPASCLACEYWGIEETDWTDAPALQEPSLHRRIRGREFDFYYSGAHLHMVVLRAGGASYWVVNTLLDSLSNETMIAIARGLRPLARR